MTAAYKEKHIWAQLKSKTSVDLKKALDNDPNWELIKTNGSRHYYKNESRPLGRDIVEIHVHPTNRGGYGEAMLKGILRIIAWTEDEMIDLKLIKGKSGKK